MSEIPFVDRLGDAIEGAISAPQRVKRRRRRRFGGLAVAVFLLGAGGVTIAEILDAPEKLATGQVACYSEPKLEPTVISVQSADGRSPTALCEDVLQMHGTALVACVHHDFVAVFPGRDTCARLGLRPLPGGYDAATAKVARLSRALLAVERSADCIAPRTLVRRAQTVLDARGWMGWKAVRGGGDGGPCGWIHQLGGGGEPYLDGLRPRERELVVTSGPPHSLADLLYGEGSRGNRMVDATGRRCLTVAGVRAAARAAFPRHPVSVRVSGPLAEGTSIEAPRGTRYYEGCAIAAGVGPDYDAGARIGIEVEVAVRD
ncbi:MAG TPA: hypothetical protein VGW10_19370 [Solirubrobacteraceae bacterium]|nr:hypothetical protein [Solirubrobacteraceae bacterium]